MITVHEAKKIIETKTPHGLVASSPLGEALGRVAARDVISPFDYPLFASSAMDGYAVNHEEVHATSEENPVRLPIQYKIFAGDYPTEILHSGHTIRIMTGAMIPEGVTAVIPQEEIIADRDFILVRGPTKKNQHIRFQGEEIRKGERALSSGVAITPAVLGYLASLGIPELPIYAPPSISILPTGSELVLSAKDLLPGRIFESNSVALRGALLEMHLETRVLPPVADTKEEISRSVATCLEKSDMVLICGGVSVGDKDYVREVLEVFGVTPHFWKIAQKPGKPLFFGTANNKLVFGLPGNPASSLVCFYEYVKPAILQWMGFSKIWPKSEKGKLMTPFKTKKGRTQFLRAWATREGQGLQVRLAGSQESHRMQGFAGANCFAVVNSETEELQVGSEITVHWI